MGTKQAIRLEDMTDNFGAQCLNDRSKYRLLGGRAFRDGGSETLDLTSYVVESFFSNISDKLRNFDEKGVRVNQRQCKAGDTVPGSMSKPRGIPTIVKIDLINKRSVDQFQRLN